MSRANYMAGRRPQPPAGDTTDLQVGQFVLVWSVYGGVYTGPPKELVWIIPANTEPPRTEMQNLWVRNARDGSGPRSARMPARPSKYDRVVLRARPFSAVRCYPVNTLEFRFYVVHPRREP